MWWSTCVLQRLEDKEVEKTRATFHRKPQPYSPMGRAADLHSGGHGFEFSWCTLFFLKINTFWIHFFKSPALIALLLGTPSMHQNKTWAKLNACHLETRLWLMGYLRSFFTASFFTACWRHRCREKTKYSCGTFLSKPHRKTVVNQLSCRFNHSLSQTFFQFLELFRAFFFLWSQLFELLLFDTKTTV